MKQQAVLRTVVRNWPFANGSGRLIDRLGPKMTAGDGERVCRTSDGFDISIFENDHIGRHISLSGRFDRSTVAVLLDFCEPGDRCIDIGANIGYVAGVILSRVPGSHVTCVEPQPAVVRLLAKNLARFGAGRWVLHPVALGDAEAEGHLALDAVNRGASTIVDAPSATTVTVPMLPAARLLGGMPRLDVLKMDVEGHEAVVFRSSLAEIDRLQPRAMLYEDAANRSGPEGAIGALLAQIGYRVYGIRKTLLTTGLKRVTEANAAHFHDFVALSARRPLPSAAVARYRL